MTGFGNGRNITVTATGSFSLDGHKALMFKVAELEQMVDNHRDASGAIQNLPAVTDVTIIVNTKHPFKVYVFTLTANYVNGTYAFTFVEEAPNVESITPESSEA